MPPKPKDTSAMTGKQYDEVIVIALILQMKSGATTINPALKDMALLDGIRSHSAFEHQLRAANKLAGELLMKRNSGVTLGPEDIGRVSGAATPLAANTPPKRKNSSDDGDDVSPKKQRATLKKKGKKEVAEEANGDDANAEAED